MAIPTLGSTNTTAGQGVDTAALALLQSLRDHPDIQKDPSLMKMFNDALSFMAGSKPHTIESSLPTHSHVSTLLIDTSGKDGFHGTPGGAGALGEKGVNGLDGTNGEDARGINLTLKVKDGLVVAEWEKGYTTMILGDPTVSISPRAVGGNGGYGGMGGLGGLGIKGARGKDATRTSNGENGARGGSGGAGGNGGKGGSGGSGGNITVRVGPEDTDLFMLLRASNLTGGSYGVGGTTGTGGPGGSGGEGGSSYTWTETLVGYHSVSNGKGGSHMQSYTYTVTHTNPGGVTGPQGLYGMNGKIGSSGSSGKNGTFQMVVGSTLYQSLYDLTVRVAKIVDLTKGNPQEIHEPGEQINLGVSVFNSGEMPTPSQDVELSMRSASWIDNISRPLFLHASESVPQQGGRTLSHPFSFQVKQPEVISEEPYLKEEILTYNASLLRIKKSFPGIAQQKDRFTVQYPVQISTLKKDVSYGLEETLTFSLFIRNISSIPMGKEGPQKRRVFVIFEFSKLEEVDSDNQEIGSFKEPDKITIDVDYLSPDSQKPLEVAFRLGNSNENTRTKIRLIASLYLDCFALEATSETFKTRCIQKRTFQD